MMILNTEPNKEDYDTPREKDNLLINQNNSVIGGPYMGSLHNITEANYEFSSIMKEKENQLSKLKKSFDRNSNRLADMFKKREVYLNLYFKNGIKDFYFEYLKSMVKSHNLKIYIIDNKFKDKYNNSVIEVKEDYIVNLENQLKYRDEIIQNKNVTMQPEESEKLKTLDQLKKEYSINLPPIMNFNKNKNINIFNSGSMFNKKDYEFADNDKNSG